MKKLLGIECTRIEGQGRWVLSFRVSDKYLSRARLAEFLKAQKAYESKTGNNELVLSLEVKGKARTLDQNRLLRALESVLSMEQYGSTNYKDEFHEGLIEIYCPYREGENPLTGKVYKKRTSELTTVEMAKVIEGAFYELASMGVSLSAHNIISYWAEWMSWKEKQGIDLYTEDGKELGRYKQKTPFCVACGEGLITVNEMGNDVYKGQMAHIIPRSGGGVNAVWNMLHLCTNCHIFIQHTKGFGTLIERYPHIAEKVKKAQARRHEKK